MFLYLLLVFHSFVYQTFIEGSLSVKDWARCWVKDDKGWINKNDLCTLRELLLSGGDRHSKNTQMSKCRFWWMLCKKSAEYCWEGQYHGAMQGAGGGRILESLSAINGGHDQEEECSKREQSMQRPWSRGKLVLLRIWKAASATWEVGGDQVE